jgi:hypothetical protein
MKIPTVWNLEGGKANQFKGSGHRPR